MLKESEKLRRVTQIKGLLRIRNLHSKLVNTWFTDECWFTSDGIAQKKDGYYWALSKEAVKPVEFQEHPIKVHVWSAISVRGIIGPYFFHQNGQNINVNQFTYQDCLRWFIKELKTRKFYRSAILMQDGATPHTALSTRTFLNDHFRNRVIGKHFDWPWPPRSPDLTPADFYLWPVIKRNMYVSSSAFKSIGSLKRSITYHHRGLSRLNRDFLIPEVIRRWKLCVEMKGSRL